MQKFVLGVVAVSVLLIVAGVMFIGGGDKDGEPTVVPEAAQVSDSDWITGNPSGSVTVVEYSDFQCPACGAYHPFLKQMLVDFPDVRFVYRHFPLRQVHKNAQLAAQAAQAAGQQDKFWEMHDKLFETQSEWAETDDPTETFVGFAKDLGLDTDQFTTDLTSEAVVQAVNEGYSSGLRAGVNSTPSLFIDGVKIDNPATYAGLKALIEKAVAAAGPSGNVDTGTEATASGDEGGAMETAQ